MKGPKTHAVYQCLKGALPAGGEIDWNFATKFVVDRNGVPCKRFNDEAEWETIEVSGAVLPCVVLCCVVSSFTDLIVWFWFGCEEIRE